jgi:hypothetical protein
MPIDIARLASTLQPERTVLLLGAGSSLPSGAPSVLDIQRSLESTFRVSASEYSLPEQTGIIEAETRNRGALIARLRSLFAPVKATGAILNLPLYDWKSIFTTNYDKVVEESYARKNRPISVYASNFDFSQRRAPDSIQYFKLHGTIDEDVSDGGKQSRIIVSQNDYDLTEEYRQHLWDRFRSDLAGAHLVIVGHSLGDRDVKDIIDRALAINRSSGGDCTITAFIYTRDAGRATLFENRGMQVCFGGLDDLFAGLASRVAAAPAMAASGDPLDRFPALRPATIEIAHSLRLAANVSAMFNGWPASYADVTAGLTFKRDVAGMVAGQLKAGVLPIAVVLGPSGVGKTTAARQALVELNAAGFLCWEHKLDQQLLGHEWREVAKILEKDRVDACLLVDDAHMELDEINSLVDDLNIDKSTRLRLILASSKNQWNPRVKSTALNKASHEYTLYRVLGGEIDRLLDLVESVPEVRALVGAQFAGFSRLERRRRLVERCEADMFVCLKNIFASEKFDDIILREFAGLPNSAQGVYRVVAAMEYAGVRVHRQLVIRLLGFRADAVPAILSELEDIIHEETINEREGVYAWYGRHKVIMGIIADHKYYKDEDRFKLFSLIIDNIQPTYDIELKTIDELCSVETGLATITDRKNQNILLRKAISVAPGQRVPRHRLLRNLVWLQRYDEADTELRLFEKDFGRLDGPANRYRIEAATSRALHTPGILAEDRVTLLRRTLETASAIVRRYPYNKGILGAYCELGLGLASLTADCSAFDQGIELLRTAERITGDADIPRVVSRLERRMERVRAGLEVDEQMLDADDPLPTE